MEIPDFQTGKTVKAKLSQIFYAGKGINVAFTLKELGYEPEVIAFVGENQIYSYSQALSPIKKTLIPVFGDTRNNITIIDPQNQTETHIREPGFQLSQENLLQLQAVLNSNVSEGDWIILTGSLPFGAPDDLYAKLIHTISAKNAYAVLDSSGAPLIEGAKAAPRILKINTEELAQLAGRSLFSESEMIHESNSLLKNNCEFVVITQAKNGALGVNREGAWSTEIPAQFPAGLNTVGCGDAFLGGLIAKLTQNTPFETALAYATACGAANTLISGAGRIERTSVERIVSKIRVSRRTF
ncbi:hexose kinase [candidate division KSB1 bacterium]|nr:hexose kinase [candidate division KSB1 bacterium]